MSILVRLFFLVFTITSSLSFCVKLKMAIDKKVSRKSFDKILTSNNVIATKSLINPTDKGIFSGGDFKELVTESSIFIDKSLFIKEIIKSRDKITLITMPRRWGKSANLDMLARFLSIETDNETGRIIPKNETDNYELFAGGDDSLGLESGLKIAEHQDIMLAYLGEFPVIFMDFKSCKKKSGFTAIETEVRSQIIELFIDHAYLGTSDKVYSGNLKIKDIFNEILKDLKEGKSFDNAIKVLSNLLYKQYDKLVWILIDEYDAAANEAYMYLDIEEATKVVDLFRRILEPALKGNKYLYKGVITGLQYIVKSGMLSGLNNLGKYSIQNSKYSQYYGANKNEMELLWSHFNVSDDYREKMKDFYNGYREKLVGTNEYIEKYNIWSVINYLNKQEAGLKSYWEESASFDFIEPLLRKDEVLEKINTLVDGGSIDLALITDFSVTDFKILKELVYAGDNYVVNDKGLDVLFSYLFITGYLTETSNNKFKCPNQEIKYSLGKYLISYYKNVYRFGGQKISDLTIILQKLFDKRLSITMNEKEKIEFIKRLFKSKFLPKFRGLMDECTLVNDKNAIGGIFANEASVHSILNYIGIQVADTLFGTEIYMTKVHDEEDENSPDFNEQTTKLKKGRLDMLLKNNITGLIFEVKYRGSALKALKQAKLYANLINDQEIKIFVGLDVSENKTVTIAGEICIRNKRYRFYCSI